MKSLTTSSALKTIVSKPKVSFNVDGEDQDQMMVSLKETDPLPIVELKPFVQKVWRREKSFASTLERSPSVATVKSEKSEVSRATTGSKGKDVDTTSDVTIKLGTEESSSPSPPPKTAQSLPPRLNERWLTFYVNAFEDFKSQKEHFNKFVGESGFRPKSRLHPVFDPKNRKQPEHAVSIIPGFITRDDRTKTTLNEISDGESVSRFYSCSPKAIGPEEIKKQQQIRIAGETYYPAKRNTPTDYSPTPSKATNISWHGPSVRHGSPASLMHQHKRQQRNKRVKTPLYDYLDRTGSLPSLSINATSLIKRTPPKRTEDMQSEDYMDYREAYDGDKRPNVGGIENSLMVLSKHGTPTKVERQISFELEKNLSRFRKLKDYSPFEINPSELAKYYPPPTYNMTQGEAFIRQAMASNASRRNKRKLKTSADGKITAVSSTSYSGSTNDQFIQGILRKSFNDIEHIDSYDSLYGPYNKMANNACAYTPDEEPAAPFDTPRSMMESRISSKNQNPDIQAGFAKAAPEMNTAETKVSFNTGDEFYQDARHSVDIETQTPRAPAADRIDIKDNDEAMKDTKAKPRKSALKSESKQSLDIQSVQLKTAQPQPTQIDASGRTFLTSDNIPQVAVVSS